MYSNYIEYNVLYLVDIYSSYTSRTPSPAHPRQYYYVCLRVTEA